MSLPADTTAPGLDPDQVVTFFDNVLPHPGCYWVAFSGGVDSTVLLHLLTSIRNHLPAPLRAIHVDHRLQTGSAGWAADCRARCDALGVPIEILTVNAAAQPGQSPEAAAREARYAAIANVMNRGDMLLTAHHQDDQAETVLLQLLRGAGVSGLAGMPPCRAWGKGWLARPLLGTSRDTIVRWARDAGLSWTEDPSNASHGADRNFLRHRIMPVLAERWPAASRSLARSAVLCGEASNVVAEQADADLRSIEAEDGRRLQVDELCRLDPARRTNAMRRWLQRRDTAPLPAARLQQALQQVCRARSDAAVRIAWPGHVLRRFQGQVWLLENDDCGAPAQNRRPWSGDAVDLGPGLGRLHSRLATGGIDPTRWQGGQVEIAYRTPGMLCRPAGRRGTRDFKHLAQELGIPPWLRDRVPVILIDRQPAAIAGYIICEPFADLHGEGIWPVWEPPS